MFWLEGHKVGGEPRHAHDQVTVLLWGLQRALQGLGVDDGDLELLSPHVHVGLEQAGQPFEPFFSLQVGRRQPQVDRRAARRQPVVGLGQRPQGGSRAALVAALRRRPAIAERLSGQASVGRCGGRGAHAGVAEHRAEHGIVDRVRRRRGVAPRLPAKALDDAHGDGIGTVVVVAVLGGALAAERSHAVVPRIVGCQGVQEGIQGQRTLVVGQGTDRSQAVYRCAQAHAIGAGEQVARAAARGIHAALQAVVDERRVERLGGVGAEHGVIVVLGGQHLIEGVFDLALVGGEQVIETVKPARIACRWPQPDAGEPVAPVVQGQFQAFCQVEVAVRPGGTQAGQKGLHTAHLRVVAHDLGGQPIVDQPGHDHLVVENGRMARATADRARDLEPVGLRRAGVDARGEVGLLAADPAIDLQAEGTQVVRRVLSLRRLPTQAEVGDVIAFAVELDPE